MGRQKKFGEPSKISTFRLPASNMQKYRIFRILIGKFIGLLHVYLNHLKETNFTMSYKEMLDSSLKLFINPFNYLLTSEKLETNKAITIQRRLINSRA
ncbi:MAG: hypothetical protein E3J90_06430 [Promethearchaeota archaeon]|nr:MAG: hypothetical protein E3J90_06430 [Candidatus Lokiarchaeota archaeon]